MMRRFFDRFFPPKPFGEGWWERRFRGHWSCGPVCVYGWNAMHVAVDIQAFGTFICFHPTWRVFGHWWPWYFYISPDATRGSARFKLGPGAHC